jgi:hypothetical protein
MKKISQALVVLSSIFLATTAPSSAQPISAGQVCTLQQIKHDAASAIDRCKQLANSNQLSASEKSNALFTLGYGYMLVDLQQEGFSINNLERTIVTWRMATSIDKGNMKPLLALASLNRIFMRPQEAELIYAEIEQRAPGNWQAYIHHSLNLRSIDEQSAPTRLILSEKAIALQPQQPMAHYALGMALLANHKQEEAIVQLRMAEQNFDTQQFDEAGLMPLEAPSAVMASIVQVTPTAAAAQ